MNLDEALQVADSLPKDTVGCQRPLVWEALEVLAGVVKGKQPVGRYALCRCCGTRLIDGICGNCDC